MNGLHATVVLTKLAAGRIVVSQVINSQAVGPEEVAVSCRVAAFQDAYTGNSCLSKKSMVD